MPGTVLGSGVTVMDMHNMAVSLWSSGATGPSGSAAHGLVFITSLSLLKVVGESQRPPTTEPRNEKSQKEKPKHIQVA